MAPTQDALNHAAKSLLSDEQFRIWGAQPAIFNGKNYSEWSQSGKSTLKQNEKITSSKRSLTTPKRKKKEISCSSLASVSGYVVPTLFRPLAPFLPDGLTSVLPGELVLAGTSDTERVSKASDGRESSSLREPRPWLATVCRLKFISEFSHYQDVFELVRLKF